MPSPDLVVLWGAISVEKMLNRLLDHPNPKKIHIFFHIEFREPYPTFKKVWQRFTERAPFFENLNHILAQIRPQFGSKVEPNLGPKMNPIWAKMWTQFAQKSEPNVRQKMNAILTPKWTPFWSKSERNFAFFCAFWGSILMRNLVISGSALGVIFWTQFRPQSERDFDPKVNVISTPKWTRFWTQSERDFGPKVNVISSPNWAELGRFYDSHFEHF